MGVEHDTPHAPDHVGHDTWHEYSDPHYYEQEGYEYYDEGDEGEDSSSSSSQMQREARVSLEPEHTA